MFPPPPGAVFLSYASQDTDAARRLSEALRAVGVEVWFDQNELVGGDAWDAKIRRQIAECALFVPIISANTQARLEGYFRIEWKLAAQRTHAMAEEKAFLLPVVIDATRDAEAKVPADFKSVQWTRLRPEGDDPALAKFCARVKKLLGGEPADADPVADREPSQRPGRPPKAGSRPWLVPVGLAVAVLAILALWRPWATKLPFATGPTTPAAGSVAAAPGAATEIVQLRQKLRPDEWTLADFKAFTPVIDRLIQAQPDNGEAWALRTIANSLIVVRNFDSGTKPLEAGKDAADRALRLSPSSPLAELALGLHHVAMISRGGDPRACRPHIERGLAGLPTESLTRFAELVSYWLGYQFEGSEQSARTWLAADPKASFPAWILAQYYTVTRRPAETARWADQAASDPDITGVRALVSLFEARYYLQADLAGARAALDRVPSGQRGVHRVVVSRFLLAMAEQRFDQALQELSRTPESMMLDRVYHGPKALLAGLAHDAAGRRDVAQVQFRDAERLLREELAHDADNQELRAVLALNLACLGRADEARRELAAIEPLVGGQQASVYTGQLLALIAQTHGVLDEMAPMTTWLRRLFSEPSSLPFTPASLRIDPRFGRHATAPEIQALLKEFASLDQPMAGASGDDKSVAVLAFANLSDDKANEYFSDGISEELLNVLAKVPGLKVSARTSAFFFKGKSVPIPEIAQKLGVAYVVEGSVRKAGSRVRITAQLIKAADGFHVWSDNFDRELKDIFAVQDEIAGLIAKNLQLKLGTGRSSGSGTVSAEALALYLEGRQGWNLRSSAGYDRAEVLLRRALEIDPRFARGHAALADVWHNRYQDSGAQLNFANRHSAEITRILAKVDEALALDPNCAEAYASQGSVAETRWDFAAGIRSLRRAIELNPNYASAHQWLGRQLLRTGYVEEALAEFERAAALDPFSHRILDNFASSLEAAGRLTEAWNTIERARALRPNGVQITVVRTRLLLELGRRDEALAEARRMTMPEFVVDNADDVDFARYSAMGIFAACGLHAEAEAWLPLFREATSNHTMALLYSGRTKEVLANLETLDTGVLDYVMYSAFPKNFDPLRNTPEFQTWLVKVGLKEAHDRVQAWRAAHPPEKIAGKK